MADEKPEGDKPAAAAKAAGPSKVVPAMIGVNLAATGFVVFKVLTMHPGVAPSGKAGAPGAEGAKPGEAPEVVTPTSAVKGPIVALDPFVANLNDPGLPKYIKLTLELEMANEAAAKNLEKAKPVLRDQVLGYLSSIKSADTLGEPARQAIHDGILKRMNDTLGPDQIRRMFFADFVVQ